MRNAFLRRVAGKVPIAALLCLAAVGSTAAQAQGVHYWHAGVMPPGAIGSRQLQRGGPLRGYFQPVEIKAPEGVAVSVAADNQFDAAQPAPRRVGFLIGSVYRLRVTQIAQAEGMEVFPSIEVIDRTYAPNDQRLRFSIPVEITADDLALALAGKFVTRVIYLEDPHNAQPVASAGQPQSWFEAEAGRDPLAVADGLGRPVAILRMGGRVPDQGNDPNFFFGSPTWFAYPPRPAPSVAKPQAVPAKKA